MDLDMLEVYTMKECKDCGVAKQYEAGEREIEELKRIMCGGATKDDTIYCADRLKPDKKVGHIWIQARPMSPIYPLCDREFKKKERYSLLRNNLSGECCKICARIYKKLPDNKDKL